MSGWSSTSSFKEQRLALKAATKRAVLRNASPRTVRLDDRAGGDEREPDGEAELRGIDREVGVGAEPRADERRRCRR